jgi:uncharacterized membrane protein YGL010W
LAAFLPFSLLPVTVFGVQTNAATLLVMPALLFWISLDVAIGLGIVVVAIPLLFAAAAIVSHVSVAWVWIITAALTVIGWAMQIIGHKCFEGNWPALVDNPMHMLMSPMYFFAKLFVALGYRPDLAALIQKSSRQMSRGSPLYPSEGRADAGQHP